MIRNVPVKYTQRMLTKEWPCNGDYDFLFLPCDQNTLLNMSYAFINFVTHTEAVRAWEEFEDFRQWKMASKKVCAVHWGKPLQGLEDHIERY